MTPHKKIPYTSMLGDVRKSLERPESVMATLQSFESDLLDGKVDHVDLSPCFHEISLIRDLVAARMAGIRAAQCIVEDIFKNHNYFVTYNNQGKKSRKDHNVTRSSKY